MVVTLPPQDLAEGPIAAQLRGIPWVKRWWFVPSVGSTSDELRRLAAAGAEPGTVVIANEQTAGRGRSGRSWHSAAGRGLYLSILLRPSEPAVSVTRWTILAALAAAEACRTTSGVEPRIKWPNDLVLDGRKLGGILTESRTTGSRIDELILGIGINVHHTAVDFPPELASSATSLALASGGTRIDRSELAAALLRRVGIHAEGLARGGWPAIVAGWEQLNPDACGRRVRVLPAGPGEAVSEGVTCGLDELGALRVRRDDGQTIVLRRPDSILALES